MSSIPPLTRKPFARLRSSSPNHTAMFGIALLIYMGISWSILSAHEIATLRFRIDIAPFLDSKPVLQIHIVSAVATFLIGLVLLLGLPKGTRLHKQLGWSWVICMASTAISSFFLVGLAGGHYSWIHGLSAWTIIALPFAVAAARRHKVAAHARHMRSMFLGGMMIAGLFSFLPGRTMWHIFFAI